MTTASLSICESVHHYVFRESASDPDSYHFTNATPFRQLCSLIEHLPFKTRKFLLNACRIQQRISINQTLSAGLYELASHAETATITIKTKRIKRVKRGGVRISKIVEEIQEAPLSLIPELFDNIYSNPVLTTCLSYLCRAEKVGHTESYRPIRHQAILKEISASQEVNRKQQLSFASYFGGDDSEGVFGFFPNFPRNSISQIEAGLRRFINSNHDNPHKVFFPCYNGTKNVGYRTQNAIMEFRGLHQGTPGNLSTLTLLRIYHETGSQIGGPMEVRVVWRFADTTPRVYYCLGGDAYFAGMYLKEIVKEILI